MMRLSAIAAAGLLVALVTAIPGLWSGYAQFIVAAIAYTSIGVLSVSALAGLTGIWSLGHTAFVALGAYLAANLSEKGVPLEIIVPSAFLAAGLLGFLLGLFAGRFTILYFGLLTMALCLTSTEVIGHAVRFTGGEGGMNVTPARIYLLNTNVDLKAATFVSVGLATISFMLMSATYASFAGKKWLAVKSQRTAAASIGIRPQLENAKAFALSAAVSSLSGVGIAYSIGFLDPVSFDLNSGVNLIVATVVGGAGSVLGALVGAFFIVAVPEASRNVPLVAGFVFGGVVVGMLLLLRQGIVPSLAAKFKRREATTAEQSTHHWSEEAVAALVGRLLPPADRDLEVRGLNLSFGGVKALSDISLTLPRGRSVGLIGPNGAGKTSFLNILSGFYEASSGSVRLGDVDMLALGVSDRQGAGLGRTFQHAELFRELTLREMVEVSAELGAANRATKGLPAASPKEIAQQILDGLDLIRWAHSRPGDLPFGIQKVADVARVLATGASVIALDEPFAGLDKEERAIIRTILNGMRKAEVSILIIDHAVEEVMHISDRAVVFEFGRLIVEGSPKEVRRHPEVLRAYFGSSQAAATGVDVI